MTVTDLKIIGLKMQGNSSFKRPSQTFVFSIFGSLIFELWFSLSFELRSLSFVTFPFELWSRTFELDLCSVNLEPYLILSELGSWTLEHRSVNLEPNCLWSELESRPLECRSTKPKLTSLELRSQLNLELKSELIELRSLNLELDFLDPLSSQTFELIESTNFEFRSTFLELLLISFLELLSEGMNEKASNFMT